VNVTLWIVQGLLALAFFFAGGMKFMMSPEEMAAGTPLPGVFFQFIGACEVIGALGLILPGLLKIKTGLTPLAAAGLTIIMLGATILTAIGMGGPGVPPIVALIPLVIGLLAAFVAYSRWNLVPLPERAHAEDREPVHAGH
jgi:hypothetical protein